MTFGFASAGDALSWIVALTLGAKVAATSFVLIVDKDMRDRPGWGAILWWVTKIAPIVAVSCLLALAWLRDDAILARLSGAAALFVAVAVPLKIRQRRVRVAERASAQPNAFGQVASRTGEIGVT